ncbi:MAG: phosphoribosylglycinamide formyltransferase [Deferribacteraceae bacterium]|jgi:phosphoribosylglycinamide formyltransferase-1|nr:phosphoribosylglycinamide formyltransferase [Deferribacteraceae bacterium]
MNLAIFISGRGSNLQAINEAIQSGHITNARIACVISNKEQALGLSYARNQGLEAHYVNPKAYESRDAYDAALLKMMQERNIDLICLAGYMRIITPVLTEAYAGRMMNIHPSLLPAFGGLDAQKQALDYGVKVSGCTVHFVDSGMDTGPVILQRPVLVEDNDSVESLSARIHEQEHKAYPMAIQLFTSGKLELDGRVVRQV